MDGPLISPSQSREQVYKQQNPPDWALYIEAGELEAEHPEWSLETLLTEARKLYWERHPR